MTAEGQRPLPLLLLGKSAFLNLLIVILVIRIQAGGAREGGLIDTHGQRTDVAQALQPNGLTLARHYHILINQHPKRGIGHTGQCIAQLIDAWPFVPTADGLFQPSILFVRLTGHVLIADDGQFTSLW